MAGTNNKAGVEVTLVDPGVFLMSFSGDWRARRDLPGMQVLLETVTHTSKSAALHFNTQALSDWNSGLITFLLKCSRWCRENKIEFAAHTLPDGIRKLIELAEAVPEQKDARGETQRPPVLHRIGEATLSQLAAVHDWLSFIGECLIAISRLLRGKARFQWADALLVLQQCGAGALPIVALINFLVGLILAFVGAVQLAQFGASIYVADLVGVAMTREMACIMTGIIICGRTGASFAAQLGSMKVNEEIDSFRTFGLDPIEFLVMPRIVALVLMMPLLCVFAAFLGILGGVAVSQFMLDLSLTEYLNQTANAISLSNFALGIMKGSFFGLLVALTGCLRGMQCGGSSSAVGVATTSAVVSGITGIIIADAIFAILCNALNL